MIKEEQYVALSADLKNPIYFIYLFIFDIVSKKAIFFPEGHLIVLFFNAFKSF